MQSEPHLIAGKENPNLGAISSEIWDEPIGIMQSADRTLLQAEGGSSG